MTTPARIARAPRLAVLVVVVASACGPKHKPDNGGGGGSGSGSATGSAVAAAPLTEAECAMMIHHMIDVTNDEKYRDAPDDKPLPDQVDKVKAQAVADGNADCITSFDRETFECVVAATTVAGLTECAK